VREGWTGRELEGAPASSQAQAALRQSYVTERAADQACEQPRQNQRWLSSFAAEQKLSFRNDEAHSPRLTEAEADNSC
jgi:hypothetical protein